MEGQHPWKACGADGLRPSIQLGTFKRGQNSLLGAGHLKENMQTCLLASLSTASGWPQALFASYLFRTLSYVIQIITRYDGYE